MDEKELKRRVMFLRIELDKQLPGFFKYDVKRLDSETIVIKPRPLTAPVFNKAFIKVIEDILQPKNYEFLISEDKIKVMIEV